MNIINLLQEKILPIFVCLIFFAIFYPLNYWLKDSSFWLYYSNLPLAQTQLCEFPDPKAFIRQPLNTLSNVFFLFYSIEIFVFALKDRKLTQPSNMLTANYQYSIVFAVSFLVLFICSSLYHASMLSIFCQMDMAGVYACILFPLFYTIHKSIAAKYYQNRPYFSYYGSALTIACFCLSIYICTMHYWQHECYYVIPVLSAALIFLTAYHLIYYVKNYKTIYMVISLICAVVAVLFYILDKVYCNALSYFQLHSVWHLLSSTSLFTYYLYLRSEKNLIYE